MSCRDNDDDNVTCVRHTVSATNNTRNAWRGRRQYTWYDDNIVRSYHAIQDRNPSARGVRTTTKNVRNFIMTIIVVLSSRVHTHSYTVRSDRRGNTETPVERVRGRKIKSPLCNNNAPVTRIRRPGRFGQCYRATTDALWHNIVIIAGDCGCGNNSDNPRHLLTVITRKRFTRRGQTNFDLSSPQPILLSFPFRFFLLVSLFPFVFIVRFICLIFTCPSRTFPHRRDTHARGDPRRTSDTGPPPTISSGGTRKQCIKCLYIKFVLHILPLPPSPAAFALL